MKKFLSLIVLVILALCFTACTNNTAQESADTAKEAIVWDSATYKEDTTLGAGSKTVQVEVKVEDKSVTFTIKTDKETLGDALLEHKLVSGEEGAYGLYIKFVNGIEADYSKTKSYWSFCKDGESMPYGVDGEEIKDGAHYELVYTKE